MKAAIMAAAKSAKAFAGEEHKQGRFAEDESEALAVSHPGSIAGADDHITTKLLPGETDAVAVARTVIEPEVLAAASIAQLKAHATTTAYGSPGIGSLTETLRQQSRAIAGGNLGSIESMLFAQMKTLDALFHKMLRHGVLNVDKGHLEAGDMYLRGALRAQRQCRSTAEAIGLLKNPSQVAFVRQANIGGAVQVNNGVPRPLDVRARERLSELNQLSGAMNELLPDTRTSGIACKVDPPLEAVGKVDRAKVRGR